ncbi:plasmid replication initiator TrfA [Enterobacteriaceae endosymbiont of Macroplea appendiculata]|uniref:plasmid replication initiator TrfA n=1 Tax=Enterobacteriaceae endosymbiont of Macroplea appendiculata TaxID=2675790 RepID=UPI001448F4E3|nr:plasmid replication initiator TrfA [Enterobacteriaceae endosymbiont of Macroplea appendiculata]QJC31053.1 hypothetical protein GJT86_02270 [Enterobacteriaceae endosymbiont of Macroplea appendiculata]
MCKSIYERINTLKNKIHRAVNTDDSSVIISKTDQATLKNQDTHTKTVVTQKVELQQQQSLQCKIISNKTNSVMPYVAKDKRIIPNIMLRSSLFGIIKKGHRKYEKNVLKFSLQNITIRFTGEQLDQTDLDVWLECLHRLCFVPMGSKVEFTAYSFLKSIDRRTGTKDYKWLKTCLVRLSICIIEVGFQNCFYVGHLLHEYYKNISNKKHVIILNKRIVAFFKDDMWTAISLIERKKLKGKYLSQWIHCFYCSHKIPLCYKVSTLNKLCGSTTKKLWKFRQSLKRALLVVTHSTGWKCWIDRNDFVHIKK